MTLSSFWLAGLVGGSIVIEVIFSVPGMGRLMYGAVINSDVPLLQGCVVCIVALVVGINTFTDIAYAYLNPAIRVGESGS
jgi:peptide/nickel transport system permease protein